MFENWKWFHIKYHKTKYVTVCGNKLLFCKTCDRYVPPAAIGVCCKCHKKLVYAQVGICRDCAKEFYG